MKYTCHNPTDRYYRIYPDDIKFSEEDRFCILVKTLSYTIAEPDETIEKAYKENIKGGILSEDYGDMPPLNYRVELCTDISIFSNIDMFGKKAGSDLSSDFKFLSISNSYIVGKNGNFYGAITNFNSVSDYVNSNSYIFNQCIIIPVDYLKEEVLSDCIITIEIKLDNGEKLSKSIEL